MKQLALRDTIEFWQGRDFEREIARQMLLRDYAVMRCYDLNVDGRNKAPMLEGPYQGYRLPDLQVSGNGKTEWRECKEKTRPTYTYSQFRDDHGIDLRCYRDYLAVQKLSGLPVALMIGEWKSGLILAQYLNKLGPPRIYEGNKMGPGGMVFWPRSQFRKWGQYDIAPDQLPMFGRPKRKVHYAPGHWK